MKLTEKQRRFADEYIIHGNAHKACIEAGYSKNYAKARSHEMLDNVGIKTYIDERLEKLKSEKIADQDEILQFLTATMRGEVNEPILISVDVGVQEVVEVRPSVSTRRQAAVDLGKRYSMWTDKQEVTQRTINIEVGDYDDSD